MRESAPDPRDVALGAALSAARLALAPLRLAARMPLLGPPLRRVAGELADDGAAARAAAVPAVERAVDTALAGPLPDAVAHSLAEHGVVERVAAQVLDGPTTAELTERVLASPELRRAFQEIASSPEVREALSQQTSSLAAEVGDGLRRSAGRVDGTVERKARSLLRRPQREGATPFGGAATRAIALAVDVLVADAIVLLGAALVGLAASLVGELRPQWLVALVGAVAWAVVVGGYFVLFWSVTGQTPGLRLMRLRVRGPGGGPPGLARSLVRLVGLGLAIVPLFAGFLPVLFDARRRGLPDLLAATEVVSADEPYSRTDATAAASATGPSTISASQAYEPFGNA